MKKIIFTKEDKQAMIELIEWYRDEYHRKDWCHSEMIETIRTSDDEEELEMIAKTLDLWLYQ